MNPRVPSPALPRLVAEVGREQGASAAGVVETRAELVGQLVSPLAQVRPDVVAHGTTDHDGQSAANDVPLFLESGDLYGDVSLELVVDLRRELRALRPTGPSCHSSEVSRPIGSTTSRTGWSGSETSSRQSSIGPRWGHRRGDAA